MTDLMYRMIRWVLGGIFIYTGATKLADFRTFAVLIEAYGIVPESLIMPVAFVLPAMEVSAGIGLFFDIEGSLPVIAGLLIIFVVILGYGIYMGLDVDCGCFGPEDPEAEAFHGLRLALYRDLAMLAGCAYLAIWRRLRMIRPVKLRRLFDTILRRKRSENAYV